MDKIIISPFLFIIYIYNELQSCSKSWNVSGYFISVILISVFGHQGASICLKIGRNLNIIIPVHNLHAQWIANLWQIVKSIGVQHFSHIDFCIWLPLWQFDGGDNQNNSDSYKAIEICDTSWHFAMPILNEKKDRHANGSICWCLNKINVRAIMQYLTVYICHVCDPSGMSNINQTKQSSGKSVLLKNDETIYRKFQKS